MVFSLAVLLTGVLTVSGSSLHLSPRQTRTGRSLDLVFTAPHQPLCTSRDSINNPSLLGQYVCSRAGYSTFSHLSFANISSVNVEHGEGRASSVSCSQSDMSYHISCEVRPLVSACEEVVGITCSSCHTHLPARPGSSITLTSPLYPVLQPDFICDYELISESDQALDFTLAISDLSLPSPHYSQANGF